MYAIPMCVYIYMYMYIHSHCIWPCSIPSMPIGTMPLNANLAWYWYRSNRMLKTKTKME